MNKKLISSIVLLGVMASILVGCNSSEEKNVQTTQSKGSDEKTIRVAWWGNQVRNDNTVKFIEMFERDNPGVNVEYEFLDWSGYWDKLATQAAGNNLPDIIQQDYLYLNQYVEKGLITNLTPYVESGAINLENVEENFLAGGRINGNLYAINLGANAPTMAYDPAIVEMAGVELKQDLSYEELYNIGKQIYEKTGVKSVFQVGLANLETAVRSIGKELYSADGKSLGFDDPGIIQYLMEINLKAMEEGISPGVEVFVEINGNLEMSTLATGETWNWWPFSNQLVALESAAGKELALNMHPTLNNEPTRESMYLKPSQFFSVTESCENKDIAVAFLDTYTNSLEGYKLMLAERGVPISTEIRADLAPSLSSMDKKTFEYIDFVAQNSTPIAPPYPLGGNQVDKLYLETWDAVMYKEMTPTEGAAKFMKEANDILSNQ